MKHQYIIVINKGCKMNQPISYKYGNTKDIQLRLCKHNATVSFEMCIQKTFTDFAEMKFNLFIDAYRKISLLHSIKYGEVIKIRKIIVFIDREEHDLPIEKINLHSMLEKNKLDLTERWKTNEFLSIIANVSKDSIQHDRRFCAAFAFLTSQCREYEIDRFINLWTAMNAYYGYISEWFIPLYMQKNAFDSKTKEKSEHRRVSSESCEISFLMQLIHMGAKHKGFKDNMRTFHNIERELKLLNNKDVAQLYDVAFSLMNGMNSKCNEKYKRLHEFAEEYGCPLYLILLLEMPYHLRCEYVHGNNPLLMLAYETNIELNTLRVVNYFLKKFLNDNIPSMFTDGFFDDSKYETILSFVKTK